MSQFSWLPFFEEMLSVICEKYDKNSLVDIFYSIFSDAGGIEDHFSDGTISCFKEIDLLTFIAYFNRNNTDDKRISYCSKAKAQFELKADIPQDFAGIPYFNPQNTWFLGWEKNRDPKAVDKLWELGNQLNSNTIESELIADILNIKHVGVSKLTQILFICKPNLYLSFDSRNNSYLKHKKIETDQIIKQLSKVDGFLRYKEFLLSVKNVLNKPFYEISHDAYLYSSKTKFTMTSEQLEDLMRNFKELMPDFESFENPGKTFVEKELSYKRNALKRYEEEVGNTKIKELLEQGQGKTALDEIAKRIQTNLVSYQSWNNFGSTDDQITALLHEFIESAEQDYFGPETLNPIFEKVKELGIKPTWDSYSTVLWAINPEEYAPIKITYYRELAEKIGHELPKGRPSAKKLSAVFDWMRSIRAALEDSGYNPTSWIDVQSFIWCVCPNTYSDIPIDSGNVNDKTRYWVLSPGENARLWDDFRSNNIIAVGGDKLGDFRQYSDIVTYRQKIKELYDKEEEPINDGRMCYDFTYVMKKGDFVLVKKGLTHIIGHGKIESDLIYHPSRQEYHNTRKVSWIATGNWEIPPEAKLPVKTLTDMTEYAGNLEKLLSVIIKPSDNKVNYWWLNANPKIWDISKVNIGVKQTYTTHNEKGNKRRIYKHFEAVKPGDIVLGYVSTPDKEITTICQITKGIHTNEEGESIEFETTEKIQNPVSYDELKALVGLSNCEPLINNQGSLFKLTEEEYEIIRDLIDSKNPVDEPQEPYSVEQALESLFFERNEFEDILEVLRFKKNIILQGAPGVGKTYIAKRLAYALMGQKAPQRVQMIQFHQSYSYEDFIQGYRPNDKENFALKNGVFYEFCKKAQRHPDDIYVFIIDEINRGNLSKIFGELMMLIESDKRGEEFGVPLTYALEAVEKFHIPKNLYLIGTMNTADRSLAMVDYALRRRFSFITLSPKYNNPEFKEFLLGQNVNKELVDKIVYKMIALNQKIAKDDKNLGEGYQIGHSFFCPSQSHSTYDVQWYQRVVKHEIKPLLEEYWFDDQDGVDRCVKELLE